MSDRVQIHRRRRCAALIFVGLSGTSFNVACAPHGSAVPRAPEVRAVAVHEGFVPAATGVALFYRAVGEGPDTVVVVHGGPGFGLESLAPDLTPLALDRVLIFYDQRGTGRSTLLTDSTRLTVAEHVADLGAVIAHFRLGRPALIGHSWGAGLVVRYAAAHPRDVGAVVLLEPVVPRMVPYFAQFNEALVARATPQELEAFAAASAPARWQAAPLASCQARMAILMRLWGGADSVRARVRGDACAMSAEASRAVQAYTVPAANASLAGGDLRSSAAAITGPVLLVEGLRDPTPTAAFDEWAAVLSRVTRLRVAAGGHFAHAERPEIVLPAVDAFLRRATDR